MFDNITIGTVYETELGLFSCRMSPHINIGFLPAGLAPSVSLTANDDLVRRWVKNRIFPENRVNKEKLLKLMGLTRYDALAIVKYTRVCLMEDPFWIAFKEDDTFRSNTIRGEAGLPEWHICDGGVLKINEGEINNECV